MPILQLISMLVANVRSPVFSVFSPSCGKGPLVWPPAMADRIARGTWLLPLQFLKAGMGSEGKGGILAGQLVVLRMANHPWTLKPS